MYKAFGKIITLAVFFVSLVSFVGRPALKTAYLSSKCKQTYEQIILNPNEAIVSIEDILSFPFNNYKIYQDGNRYRYYIDDSNTGDMLKMHLVAGRIYEEHIKDLIFKYTVPGTLVLDIGAHIGTHTLNLSKAVGSHGSVIAFEPQPKIFRELFMNLTLNDIKNVSLMNCGLANSEEMVEISPLVSGNEAGTCLRGNGTNLYVKTIRLDDLKLDNISLMKIDVESMENEVLRGAKETIIRNKPMLLIEIMGGTRYETATFEQKLIIHETLDLIESFGYKAGLVDGHDYIGIPIK